jgi:hypothetical protein
LNCRVAEISFDELFDFIEDEIAPTTGICLRMGLKYGTSQALLEFSSLKGFPVVCTCGFGKTPAGSILPVVSRAENFVAFNYLAA